MQVGISFIGNVIHFFQTYSCLLRFFQLHYLETQPISSTFSWLEWYFVVTSPSLSFSFFPYWNFQVLCLLSQCHWVQFICATTLLLFVPFVVMVIVVFWKTVSMKPSLSLFSKSFLSFSEYIPEPLRRGLIKISHLELSALKSLIVCLFSSLSLC